MKQKRFVSLVLALVAAAALLAGCGSKAPAAEKNRAEARKGKSNGRPVCHNIRNGYEQEQDGH